MIGLNESSDAGVGLYQLKITLKWSRPAIWRRMIVRADMKLPHFHDAIQRVMQWANSHLHQFIVRDTHYSVPLRDAMGFGFEDEDEGRFQIADLVSGAKSKFAYEYDFGDGWLHDIMVEKILPKNSSFKHPVCLAGANACPPDDCGGMGGYYRMLEILANRKHPEHCMFKEWIGGAWDPAAFDLEEINARLRRMRA